MADLAGSNPNASAESAEELAAAGASHDLEHSGRLADADILGATDSENSSESLADKPSQTDLQSGQSSPEDDQSVPGWDSGQAEVRSQRGGCGFRSLQWLSLFITLPFLALNGLAALQVRSLTHYGPSDPEARPVFAQRPLQRLGSLLFGVKVPRPENRYSPSDLGFAFESHRIDLGNDEFLEGWYVPAPKAAPESQAESETNPEVESQEESGLDVGSSASESSEDEAGGLEVVPEPIVASEKQGIVLLFPAYAASKQTLLQEIKLLHRLGYAAFAVDLRGVGDSSGSDTTLGHREAEDVAVTMDYVQKTFENPPIALYGRIMAAGHVMRAIAEFNLQPDALILEDPYAQIFSLTQAAVESAGLPRSPTTQMLTFWGERLQGGDPAALDPINYANDITVPTLVLYGSEGSWVSLDEVVGIHSQIQGPKEIVGLSSERDVPISATAVGPWMGKVETFLDGTMGN